MEVIPGGQPDKTGGKLSIDTLDSTLHARRERQGTAMATQGEVRNEERVTHPTTPLQVKSANFRQRMTLWIGTQRI